MLWHMLSRPGMDVSPLAWAALMSWRAVSGRGQPRASRCCRNQAPSSFDITPSFAIWTLTDTYRVRECPQVSTSPPGMAVVSGQVRRSSPRPVLAPLTNARISSGCRMRAGLSGSLDWRRATRPPESFLASRQEPWSLHGLRQPSWPRSAARMPLCMWFMSCLLQDVAEGVDRVLRWCGLGAHPVERLGVAGCFLGLVQVVGAGQGLAVDDVGHFLVGEPEDVEHPIQRGVPAGGERDDLDRDVRQLGRLDQVRELGSHDRGAADRAA